MSQTTLAYRPLGSTPSLEAWLRQEPFTLSLGAGFFGFYAHLGLVQVLEEHSLHPARLCGVSAGALVASAWACGRPLAEFESLLLGLSRQDFWDPYPGLGLLRGRKFRALLEEALQTPRLEDTAIPLCVLAVQLRGGVVRRLERGPLAPAVQASCAVPLMFHPVQIEGRLHVDGGVRDRAGLAALHEGERVLHHHLISRSPWRRRGDPEMEPPQRKNMCTLVIDGLSRVNPFHLERGAQALARARRATEQALTAPAGPLLHA